MEPEGPPQGFVAPSDAAEPDEAAQEYPWEQRRYPPAPALYVGIGSILSIALIATLAELLASPATTGIYLWVAVSVVGAVIGAYSIFRGVDRRQRFVSESQTKALEIAAAYAVMKFAPSVPFDSVPGQAAWAEKHLERAENALRATGAHDEAMTVHDARLGAERPAVFAEPEVSAFAPTVRQRREVLQTEDTIAWARKEVPDRPPRTAAEPDAFWGRLGERLRPYGAAPIVVAIVGVIATLIGSGAALASVTKNPPSNSSPVVANNLSPVIRLSPVIKSTPVGGVDCVVYLAELDRLVDDEPDVASHLPGGSLVLDDQARTCGLKHKEALNAVAAYLAQR